MFLPDYVFDRIWNISVKDIKNMGVEFLLLDVDNTLTGHNGQKLYSEVFGWVSMLKKAGIVAAIISNNKSAKVKEFASALELQYVCRARKPLGRGFKILLNKLGCCKSRVAVIGDQIYTDILGGNLVGIITILVQPLEREKEWLLRIKRFLERPFLKKVKFEKTLRE
ncbi:MAG: YqeG family HAD IIIA-type phosphatase [Oscillospiraceae bacterium]|nr:YqeG family HAD IIIA-type phosphatase [Oscillospiraceae bacterium]